MQLGSPTSASGHPNLKRSFARQALALTDSEPSGSYDTGDSPRPGKAPKLERSQSPSVRPAEDREPRMAPPPSSSSSRGFGLKGSRPATQSASRSGGRSSRRSGGKGSGRGGERRDTVLEGPLHDHQFIYNSYDGQSLAPKHADNIKSVLANFMTAVDKEMSFRYTEGLVNGQKTCR